MKTKVLCLLVAMSLSGCLSLHGGVFTDSVAISGPNFSFVKSRVSGTATSTYFLGIGGLGTHGLVAEARRDLARLHPLGSGQAYANVSTDFDKTMILGVFVTHTCIITADIVQFLRPAT